MEATKTQVTIDSHYAFVVDTFLDDDELSVEIAKLKNGDFQVTGLYGDVQSFVEMICIDDEESVNEIMDTEIDV